MPKKKKKKEKRINFLTCEQSFIFMHENEFNPTLQIETTNKVWNTSFILIRLLSINSTSNYNPVHRCK